MDKQPARVRKASGEYEPYSEAKVRSSLQRAGAETELIAKVVSGVRDQLYDGIPTKELYHHVYALLRRLRSPLVSRYNLKRAIMQLGPSGFPFERFVAGILKAEGYEVRVGQTVRGKCVEHEIDVIARKGSKHLMVEAKFHNLPGIKSDLQVALYTYARFLDVREASLEIDGHRQHLSQPWLVTNTKVTSTVKEYAQCVGLEVVSWDYPADGSLRYLIEKSGLHPITCLRSLRRSDKMRLLEAGFVFCTDLIHQEIDFLPRDLVEKAKKEAHTVCRHRARRAT